MNIEKLYEMLDWNKPLIIQKKGIELAKEEQNMAYFFQPMLPNYNKNIWDNCATIIASKTDSELEPYLVDMLYWIQDINWPGAEIILNRLKDFEKNSKFMEAYTKCKKEAINSKDISWIISIKAINNK